MAHGEKHGVLFDVGYGLCDERPRLAIALRTLSTALVAHDIRKSPVELEKLYHEACTTPGLGKSSLLVQTIIAAGASADIAKKVRKQVQWDAEPLTLLPGALEALQTLRDAGLHLGILANQPASAADDLQRLGITDLVDGVWLSEAVNLHKPDPAFFQLALDALQLPPQRVAYLGDRPDNDIAPANRMGLRTVRLMLGPHAKQQAADDAQLANYNASSLEDAAKHLVEWTKQA